MESQSILNPEMLLRSEKIKEGLASKLLETFLKQAPIRFEKYRAGMAEQDWHAVAFAAHSLKSSAGYLGAERLLDICQRMEALAESGDSGRTSDLAGEFSQVYSWTIAALEEEKARWNAKKG